MWRWNLDLVKDTSGNQISFDYAREVNYYTGRNGEFGDVEYIRGSLIRQVEYTANGSLQPSARAVFLTDVRCVNGEVVADCNDSGDFPDVPIDLVCRRDDVCLWSTQRAPSFFSERKLDSAMTQVKEGSEWRTVARWDLNHLFPDPTAGTEPASEPKLWLDRVTERPGGDFQWSAFGQIEAEDYNFQSGTVLEETADFGQGFHVSSYGGGDYLKFENVDFGSGAGSLLVRYASNLSGSIEFRLGSPTGTVIGSVPVANTGGSFQFTTAVDSTISGSASGVQDLYVVAVSSGSLANLNWFRFTPSSGLPGLPATEFDLVNLANRVFNNSSEPRMRMPRIDKVFYPLGGEVEITYGQEYPWVYQGNSSDPCSSNYTGGNVRRQCDFFIAYDPYTNGGEWWHWNKYKVMSTTELSPHSENLTVTTDFEYSRPTWHYSDTPGYSSHTGSGSLTCNDHPTCNHWNDFRGHAIVEVTDSAGVTTEHRFYQGMDKDWVGTGGWAHTASITLSDSTTRTDHEWLAGRTAETRVYDTSEVHTRQETEFHWISTAGSAPRGAFWVGPDDIETWTYGTTTEKTEWDATYNTYGFPTTEINRRSTTTSEDDTYTETVYNYNPAKWILGTPEYVKVWPGTSIGSSGDELSYHRFYYDGNNSSPATDPTKGLVTRTIVYTDTSGSVAYDDTYFTYDSYGRLLTTDLDGTGGITTLQYDTTYGYVKKSTNPLNHATNIVADPGTGNPLTVTDPNSNTTTYEYDEYNRLIKVWEPTEPTTGPATHLFAYNYTTTPVRVSTSSLGSGSSYLVRYDYYDEWGRLIQTQRPATTTGQRTIEARYFDGQNRLQRETAVPFLNTTSEAGTNWVDPQWTGSAPSMDLQVAYGYDPLGRVDLAETTANDTAPNIIWSETWAYDAWTTTHTDRDGNQTVTVNNGHGQLVEVTEDPGGLDLTSTYSYTHHGLLASVADPSGTRTTIEYDVAGQKTALHLWDTRGDPWWASDSFYSLDEVGDRLISLAANTGSNDDLVAYYDYGTGARAHMFLSDGAEFDYQGNTGWWSQTSGYALESVGDRTVSGDFNNDGKDDVAAMYDYGTTARIHVWLSTGTSLAYQGSSGWWSTTSFYDPDLIEGRMVSGDFNNDNKDDVAVMYDYGVGASRIHVWLSTGTAFTYQGNSGWWASSGYYESDLIDDRLVSGDFNNDGKDDIASMYDYGTTARVHVWLSTGSALTYQGDSGWWASSGFYDTDLVGDRFTAGDFDNDGDADIAMFYDYGATAARIHVLKSSGSTFTYQGNSGWWATTSGFDLTDVAGRMTAGDYDGDGRDDIATGRYFGGGETRYDTFLSTGTAFEQTGDATTWTYQYDGRGNVTTQTGPEDTLWFAYDDLSRITQRRDTNSSGTLLAAWAYDATGQLGYLNSSTSYTPAWNITVNPLTYDDRGRLTEQEWLVDDPGQSGVEHEFTMNWAYDPAHRLTSVTYPDGDTGATGDTVSYTYNGRTGWAVSAARTGGFNLVNSATYTPQGQPLSFQLSTPSDTYGVVRSWEYYTDTLRVANLRAKTNGSGTFNILSLSFSRTPEGSVTRRMDWRNSSQAECYEYDNLQRLTAAFTSDDVSGSDNDCSNGYVAVGSGPYNHTYGYDSSGNLTNVDSTTWTYGGINSPSPNGLTTAGSNTFTYDTAGQQTNRSGPGLNQTITWTQTGMPATLTDGTDVTGFYYTADNTRLIREDPNGSLTITLGDWYEADINGSTISETDRYSFAGHGIGFATYNGTTTETWFPFTDQVNTNSVFYNHTQNGTITRQWFDPWGEPRASNGTPPSELGYTGQRSDPTSLMDYGARLYDPAHATFISPDTIIPDPTNPGDLNRYSYVRNNPATLTDPSGNCPFLVAALGGPVGALAAGTGCLGWLVGGALITTAFVASEVADHGSPGFLSAPKPASSSTDLPARRPDSGSPGFTATDSWANGIPGFTARGRPSPTVTVLPSLDPADLILIMLAADPTTEEIFRDISSRAKPDFDDPSVPPGEEWVWRPAEHAPGTIGSWFNPDTTESLHPDLHHMPPMKPHYDYKPWQGSSSPVYRWFPDGTFVPK